MLEFESEILSIISASNGIKAKDIASKLNCERSDVNAALFGQLKSHCYQDSSYKWYLKSKTSGQVFEPANVVKPDKKLSDLCKYYLNCLSIEQVSGISAFLTSKYKLDYAELSKLDVDFTDDDASKIIKRTAAEKNLVAFLGYPVSLNKFYSTKTNQNYWKITPVFLYPMDTTGGSFKTSDTPSINSEIIKQYSTKGAEGHIFDMIDLENELGFNDPESDVELDEVVSRLQMIRQWHWREKLNPDNLNCSPPITEIEQEGIYNRAIVVVAERSPYTIGLESELSQLMGIEEENYRGTALHGWLNNATSISESTQTQQTESLLEVLPLNTEQEQAIRDGMVNDLTIVTGPPGTGKSQVVTSLLINNAWREKNVLFSSKNNKAVDVVETRINCLGRKPIMLRIGGSQQAFHLAEIISDTLSYNADQADRDEYDSYLHQYEDGVANLEILKKQKADAISLRNKVDQLERVICPSRGKWNKWTNAIKETELAAFRKAFNDLLASYHDAQKESQNVFVKLFWFAFQTAKTETLHQRIIRINPFLLQFHLEELPRDINSTNRVDISRLHEIRGAIEELTQLQEYRAELNKLSLIEPIEDIDAHVYLHKHGLSKVATKLWSKWLLIRPFKLDANTRADMQRYVALIKLAGGDDIKNHPDILKQFNKLQSNMSRYLPCWAVTSLSAKGKIPLQPGFFDLVVIDEASQCDIASILPLLYRAKRAVIIGDPKQLNHITSISNRQDLNLISRYEIDPRWSYTRSSLYDLANSVVDASKVIHLRDHHRSFEDIIEFSNSEFYNGKLRVATKYNGLRCPPNTNPGIRWIDIAGQTVRPSGGGAYNIKEADCIIQEIKRLVIQNQYTGSVGVVTPFRAQADYIRESIEKIKEMKEYLLLNNDFLVDTVHKFQGDERDVIIFSPVISKNAGSGAIGFLNSTGNLFNVAVTRARAVLIVVGDINYCASCGVLYMEHFVDYVKQKNSKEPIKKIDAQTDLKDKTYPRVSNMEQVSDWEKALYLALLDAGIITTPQFPVDKYKLDLALFEGDRKLDIEVDGEMYHREWNGELSYRDQLRNHRLFEMGWDVKRFWVYQVRDELQWCIQQVKEWISKVE